MMEKTAVEIRNVMTNVISFRQRILTNLYAYRLVRSCPLSSCAMEQFSCRNYLANVEFDLEELHGHGRGKDREDWLALLN